MSDDQKTEITEEQSEAGVEAGAEDQAKPAAEGDPVEEPAAEPDPVDEPAAEPDPVDEPAAEESPADVPPADEQQAEEPAVAEDADAQAAPKPAPKAVDPEDDLDWKARRRLQRSRQSGAAGPQRSAEQRATERAEARRVKAAQRSRYRKRSREKREPGAGTPPAEAAPVPAKTRQGYVVSSARDKTITVRIDSARRHPRYEKVVRRSDTLHAHDESNQAAEGDLVRVIETRPMSKTKRWRVVEVLEKAK